MTTKQLKPNNMRQIAQFLFLAVLALLIFPLFIPNKVIATANRNFNAHPSVVFEDFNNLNQFSKWDPWTHTDSNSIQEFFSPYRGVGAGYKWSSENGDGELTINKIEPDKQIEAILKGYNLGEISNMKITFNEINPNTTKVKWTIVSKKIGYFSRYYTYFISKDLTEKMNEGFDHLEKLLKTAALTHEQAKSLIPGEIKTEVFEGSKLVAIHNQTSLDEKAIKTASEESFGQIYSYLTDSIKIKPINLRKPVTYYEFKDLANKTTQFYCGYPIVESIKLGEGMQLFTLPAEKTLVSIHKGSYNNLNSTISKMKAYAQKNKLILSNTYWEEYLNDPENIKNQDDLLTKIYIPIKK